MQTKGSPKLQQLDCPTCCYKWKWIYILLFCFGFVKSTVGFNCDHMPLYKISKRNKLTALMEEI